MSLRSNWSEVDRELNRVHDAPDAKTRAALDFVLDAAFLKTQVDVHVLTGSLKLSGRKSSDFDDADDSWKGEIEYGGPSTGVNNPVDYAIYEKSREPDEHGNHDFFAGLAAFEAMFLAVIREGLAP